MACRVPCALLTHARCGGKLLNCRQAAPPLSITPQTIHTQQSSRSHLGQLRELVHGRRLQVARVHLPAVEEKGRRAVIHEVVGAD